MTSTDQDNPIWFPSADRSSWRDTYIYNSDDRDKVLGGLRVSNGVTNNNLYSMVEIIRIFDDNFHLQDDDEQLVQRDERPLRPGDYYIFTNGSITITDEVPLFRLPSLQTGTRTDSFCWAVRERDRRCVITGRPAIIDGVAFWRAFEAAHVFPLKYEGYWKDNNYGRWIDVPPASESYGTINSVQNGILLERGIHALFDSYELSINSNDRYKIVCFTPLAKQLRNCRCTP